MSFIRFVLGILILFFNWLFTPRGIMRAPEAQAAIDAQTSSLVLYQYEACPFCVKVHRALKRRALNIETRDVKRNQLAREELLAGGGELQVPCLRIEEGGGGYRRMYESSDIIRYLEGRFVAPSVTPIV